jgi:hypothetical protein
MSKNDLTVAQKSVWGRYAKGCKECKRLGGSDVGVERGGAVGEHTLTGRPTSFMASACGSIRLCLMEYRTPESMHSNRYR